MGMRILRYYSQFYDFPEVNWNEKISYFQERDATIFVPTCVHIVTPIKKKFTPFWDGIFDA